MANSIDCNFDVNVDVDAYHSTYLTAGSPPVEEGEFAGALYFDEYDGTDNVVDIVVVQGPSADNGYELPLGGVATNGDGDFGDGVVPLDAAMSVSEAIDRINEEVKRIDDEAPDLSNVDITGGTIANVTLINVTVDGGEF